MDLWGVGGLRAEGASILLRADGQQFLLHFPHPPPPVPLVPCDWAISSFNLSSLKAILQLTPILLKNLVLLPNPSMLSSSW